MTPPPGRDRKCRMASREQRNGPTQIHAQYTIEIRQGGLVAGSGRLDSRVVDQNIETPERLDHVRHHIFDLPLAGHVRLDQQGTSSGGLAFGFGEGRVGIGTFRRTAIIQPDMGALLSEPDGNGAADPRRCPRNENVLSRQALHPFYCRE